MSLQVRNRNNNVATHGYNLRSSMARVGRNILGPALRQGVNYLSKRTSRDRFRARRSAGQSRSVGRGKTTIQGGSVGYTKTYKRKATTYRKYPKGLKRRFIKNVQGVINANKGRGTYTYISAVQLRQVFRNQIAITHQDENGLTFDMDTPLQLADAYDICWNGKTAQANYTLVPKIINNQAKLFIQNSYMKFVFKSTSSHVVNIEMYVCKRKKSMGIQSQNSSVSALTEIADAADDITERYINFTGQSNLATTSEGWNIKEYGNFFKNWHVEVRRFKMEPGAFHSEFVQGFKHKLIPLQNHIALGESATSNSPWTRYMPGSISVFFRISNDPTVSAEAGNPPQGAGQVHRWPSNDQGGVACEMHRCTQTRPLDDAVLVNTERSVAVGNWKQTTSIGADQQVTFQNPQQDAMVD